MEIHKYKTAGKVLDTVSSAHPLLVFLLLAYGFLMLKMFLAVTITPAHAQGLHFGEQLSKATITFQKEGVWQKLGEEQYKNDRLAEYQNMLIKRGITNMNDLQLLASQLLVENGAMTPDRIGDHGCSFGLLQYNACVHTGMSAKRFLADPRYKEWNDYRYQLSAMSDMVAQRYKDYDGDMLRVIVHHNSPAAASRGTDTKAGYYAKVKRTASLLTEL